MEIGLDSFVAATIDPKTGQAIEPRHLRELLEAIGLADELRSIGATSVASHRQPKTKYV
jgi:hypothetical protein